MHLRRWLPFAALILFAGCGRPEAITPSDRRLLLLHERLPFGSTPADARKAWPSVGVQTPEGLGTEMKTKVAVLGARADLEFNFQNDSLYGVFFHLEALPAGRGDALFDSLNAFYSARFGKPQISDGADDPYFVKSRDWQAPGCEIGVSNSIEGNMRRLGWGYQVPTNLLVEEK